ncbi:MAG: FAD-binding oxidoreductase [Pseudomonadota bacterium]
MIDVIVIGGGIAGLSAAARLAPEAMVSVLEAENALGYHASGRSAAMFEPNYGAASVKALSHASAKYLAKHEGGYLSPRGILVVARVDEADAFAADVRDMGLEEVSVAEATARVPILDKERVHFAGYHKGAHDIDTDRLLQEFAKTARQCGSQIHTGERVSAIDRCDGLWQVVTSKNTYRAPLLVNAAGAWADQIAVLAGIEPLGIVPHRRSMARLASPDGLDVRSYPMFFGVGENWYAKPDAGCLLVSPAEEDAIPAQDAWAEDQIIAEGLARYQEMVTVPVTRPIATWAGLRSFAPDRTLVLGPDPRMPSFIWCAGQGGYGFQTAPAASQLVADLTLARPPVLPAGIVSSLKPDRLQ